MKYQKIRGVRHYVFDNEEEFAEHFKSKGKEVPEIVMEWRDAEEGDWVKADDGGIVQILRARGLKSYNRKKHFYKCMQHRGYCRTVVGTFFRMKNAYMDTDFDNHPSRYRFTTDTSSTWQMKKRDKGITYLERRWVLMILTGRDFYDAYCDVFGAETNITDKVNLLLKQERIQKAMRDSINDIAKEAGIDHKYILTELKRIVEETDSERLKRDCLKDLGEALGTFSANTKMLGPRVSGGFIGFSQQRLAEIESPDEDEILIETESGKEEDGES